MGFRPASTEDDTHAPPCAPKPYPSDLTALLWAATAPMIPDAAPVGRPREAPKREIVEAILYLLRSGCAWRLLPRDFPPCQTAYHSFRRWQGEGVWARVHHALVNADRERVGRDASPSAAILDNQTVGTADQKRGFKGFDAGKKSTGASATS